MRTSKRIVLMLVLLFSSVALADAPKEGRNGFVVRGQEQDIYFYKAAGAGGRGKVLFAPGDGGWRGFAIDIAEQLQAAGYDVYGLDTRRYLLSFADRGGLKPADIAGDFRQIASWIRQDGKQVLLVGWSEGAGLALAASSDSQSKTVFQGLVAIGMTERNILAWRWSDLWAEVAKVLPKEPTFESSDHVGRVAPLPIFMLASSHDEYVTADATRTLFARASEPKKLVIIDAKDHKYAGKKDEFFGILKQALAWIAQPNSQPAQPKK